MKTFAALVLFLVASVAQAAPFLVGDVVSGVAQCGVFMDASAKITVPAAALQCKYDLAGLAAGSHSARMTAITSADPVWGTQESASSAPFVFIAPGVPVAPTGLKLTPN